MTELKKLDMKSVDVTSENIERIGSLFPNCITESQDENGNLKKAINFEVLQQLLSKDLVAVGKSFSFLSCNLVFNSDNSLDDLSKELYDLVSMF